MIWTLYGYLCETYMFRCSWIAPNPKILAWKRIKTAKTPVLVLWRSFSQKLFSNFLAYRPLAAKLLSWWSVRRPSVVRPSVRPCHPVAKNPFNEFSSNFADMIYMTISPDRFFVVVIFAFITKWRPFSTKNSLFWTLTAIFSKSVQ